MSAGGAWQTVQLANSAADASGRAATLLRRRVMVATKPSNPSIVNIASVCGIRGSGKECVSYQVPAPL